jgi:hypothetical protein
MKTVGILSFVALMLILASCNTTSQPSESAEEDILMAEGKKQIFSVQASGNSEISAQSHKYCFAQAALYKSRWTGKYYTKFTLSCEEPFHEAEISAWVENLEIGGDEKSKSGTFRLKRSASVSTSGVTWAKNDLICGGGEVEHLSPTYLGIPINPEPACASAK